MPTGLGGLAWEEPVGGLAFTLRNPKFQTSFLAWAAAWIPGFAWAWPPALVFWSVGHVCVLSPSEFHSAPLAEQERTLYALGYKISSNTPGPCFGLLCSVFCLFVWFWSKICLFILKAEWEREKVSIHQFTPQMLPTVRVSQVEAMSPELDPGFPTRVARTQAPAFPCCICRKLGLMCGVAGTWTRLLNMEV